MLEAHQLRQNLRSTRQELSHALYQYDAATRVIARVLRERDSYRARLEALELAAPSGGTKRPAGELPAPDNTEADAAQGEDGEQEPSGKKARPALGPAVIDLITQCSNELSKSRKKRAISPTVAAAADISSEEYSLKGSYPLHNTRKGGILSMAAVDSSYSSIPAEDNTWVATAGQDSTVQIFDRAIEQSVASLTGHKKPVLGVSFLGSKDILTSASADKTVRLWRCGDATQYDCAAVLDDMTGEAVSLNVHPTNKYFYTASADGSWYFYDVDKAECLAKVTHDDAVAYTTSGLHPDGVIYATGDAASSIKVWESRTQKCIATFDGHEGGISSLSFSENGYYLASAANDGVRLWDLRKLKNFQTLTPYGAAVDEKGKKGGASTGVTSVAFDHSGLFLAVGGADAKVYGVKQEWSVLKEWSDVAKKGVKSLLWGADAKSLLVGGADHNLRIFGLRDQ